MNNLKFLPFAGTAALMLLAACASIGRPEGGPRDITPPHYVSSNPSPGSLNFKGNKISIFFDENVQLDNPASKVAISPAQTQQPNMTANGKKVEIELKDSLLPNTTYTIDLADAVKDLNEGNILDGFAIDFSTGSEIDTLAISGIVLQARNLEPAQGMLVGVYSGNADSAIHTLPFERIARTNQLGQFTIRNLKPGEYQVFALTDNNRDLHWDRTEDVAFHGRLISPSIGIMEVSDTIAPDSVVSRNLTRYLPDNLLLTWFNEEYKAQYLQTYKRDKRNIIHIEMAALSDSLPELTIVTIGSQTNLRKPLLDVAVLERNATADTLDYWIYDRSIINSDTLLIETRYRRVDTLDNLVWQTDTLKFNMRSQKGKASVYKAKSLQEKIDSVRAKSDSVPIDTFALMQPETWLDLQLITESQHLNEPLLFTIDKPLDTIVENGLRLELCVDSVWSVVEPQPIIMRVDSFSRMHYKMDVNWISGGEYRLVVDSMAVVDIYGNYTKPDIMEFTAKKIEDYAAINFNISGAPDSVPAFVELLNGSDDPVRTKPVINGTVRFDYLVPGTYYARLFLDSNNDGQWTNGDMRLRRQPEDIYYFTKKLAMKKNWDRSESWDINALSIELQKPDDIKTNKPKPKAGEVPLKPDDESEEDYYDEFGSDSFGSNIYNNQQSRY